MFTNSGKEKDALYIKMQVFVEKCKQNTFPKCKQKANFFQECKQTAAFFSEMGRKQP